MAGSNGYNFTAGTKARANEVNSNFEWFRGHYLPVTQSSTWANTSGVYDLGSSALRWRAVYLADTSTAFNGASNAITNDNLNENAGKRVYANTLAAAVSSITISGLVGNTAIFYKLLLGIYLTATNNLNLRFNGVTAFEYYHWTGATPTSATEILLGSFKGNSNKNYHPASLAEIMIHASSDHGKIISMQKSSFEANSPSSLIENIGGLWADRTAGNSYTPQEVTSITIFAASAVIGINTRVELYSLG